MSSHPSTAFDTGHASPCPVHKRECTVFTAPGKRRQRSSKFWAQRRSKACAGAGHATTHSTQELIADGWIVLVNTCQGSRYQVRLKHSWRKVDSELNQIGQLRMIGASNSGNNLVEQALSSTSKRNSSSGGWHACTTMAHTSVVCLQAHCHCFGRQ